MLVNCLWKYVIRPKTTICANASKVFSRATRKMLQQFHNNFEKFICTSAKKVDSTFTQYKLLLNASC